MTEPLLTWNLSDWREGDAGHVVSTTVTRLAREQFPELADMFPFQACSAAAHFDDGWFVVRVRDGGMGSSNVGSPMNANAVAELCSRLDPRVVYSHAELSKILGTEWFNDSQFTYVGPHRENKVSAPHIQEHIVDWLNATVLPAVLRLNRDRVLRAIPSSPNFDVERVRASLWVLECEETSRQGTAFQLAGVGLITCHHVLGTRTMAFNPSSPRPKAVQVLAANPEIDLAVLAFSGNEEISLARGTADGLREFDHLLVAGFPNFRHGDTGTVIPGIVAGFRTVSGIRRILTNAPIVAGTSGGPVLIGASTVIGVAVTGADQMERVQETENHGVIPIDALEFLGR